MLEKPPIANEEIVVCLHDRYGLAVGEVGDETRAASVRGFRQLFAPGDVVDQAHKTARMAWLE